MKVAPIGIVDFKEIITENYQYVDKTLIIKEILDKKYKTFLFPRPRRFGKTMTMSMLNYFFNIKYKDEPNIFEGLNISKEGEKYLKHKNKYPVIFITLKDVKGRTWEEQIEQIKQAIVNMYKEHRYVLEILEDYEKEIYINILSKKATEIEYSYSLANLMEYLQRYYNQRVVVLIDEYDSLIEKAYVNGFYQDAIDFIRTFLSSALKDNTNEEIGIITGILQIAKESIFSDLNNFESCNILNKEYDEYFGFTEKEVDKLLVEYDLEEKREIVKDWYNGYLFGNTKIYNPWSILQYISKREEKPYWVNTSSNDLITQMCNFNTKKNWELVEKILRGEDITATITENAVYANINGSINEISQFLLFAGYLTVKEKNYEEDIEGNKVFKNSYQLQIPNKEIRSVFESIVELWFVQSISSEVVYKIKKALINNEMEEFSKYLNRLLVESSGSFDSNESFYHGLMFMLLASFGDRYIIESNRESGDGRYDIEMVKRDNSYGVIFEFKFSTDINNLEKDAKAGYEQITSKQYDTRLKMLGVKEIWKYGISFANKKAYVYYENK